MIRNLLIVLGLMLCFAIGGLAIYRYRASQGDTPFLRATSSDLQGDWQSLTTQVALKANGNGLVIRGLSDKPLEFTRDGKPPRWVEKSPPTQLPRILEWTGQNLQLTEYTDSGQKSTSILKKKP